MSQSFEEWEVFQLAAQLSIKEAECRTYYHTNAMLHERISSILASHAELLKATKRAAFLLIPGASISTLSMCRDELEAAIAHAEKLS